VSLRSLRAREPELFKEKVPEMADPSEVAKLQGAAVAFLKHDGFDEAELAASEAAALLVLRRVLLFTGRR